MKLSQFKTLIREEVRKVLSEYFVKGTDTIGKVMKSGQWPWASAKELNGMFKRLKLSNKFAPIHASLQKFADVPVKDFFTPAEYSDLEALAESLSKHMYMSFFDSHDDSLVMDDFDDAYKIVVKAIRRNKS